MEGIEKMSGNTVFVVSCRDDDDDEILVGCFNNKPAATDCYNYLRRYYDHCQLDETIEYSTFRVI